MKTGIFIGRFQPFHKGHERCIQRILDTNDRCLVLLRDTATSMKNPLDLLKRTAMIRARFPDSSRVLIQTISDPGAELSVYIGRDVGYELIELDPETEAISATDLRRKLYAAAGKAYNTDAPRNVQ